MKTILLIDDSLTMLKSLQASLQITGFQVETACDGVQAMNKLKAGLKPDLIITDINMPNMDGLTFIQQAKRDQAKKLGATGWMLKPAAGAELIKVIKQVLPAVPA